MLNADLILALADVDLVYIRLSALLCAADRVLRTFATARPARRATDRWPGMCFALVDAIPAGRAGKGLSGALSRPQVSGGFVVVERRADVPPVEFGSLQKHQDVVARLATQVPAILPVRFGTLLEPEHLEEALQERDEEIAEAFDLVRGRVQFTWRIEDGGRSQPAKAEARGAEPARRSEIGRRIPAAGGAGRESAAAGGVPRGCGRSCRR